MRFTYRAIDQKGKTAEGIIEAQSMSEALLKIAQRNLRPLSLKPVKALELNLKNIFGQKVNLEDKVFITKYLSLMLRVGTDLFKAINILIDDFDKPVVKNLLIEIKDNLEKGFPFYTTFAKYPKSFPPVFVNMVKSGEMSGNLERVFSDLSVSLESDRELTGKIKSALTYPIILFVASILILILLVSYSLPKIANVFLSGGLKPPTFSRIVFAVGLFVGAHLAVLLTLFIGSIVGAVFFFGKTALGKRVLYDFALRLPVIKKVIKEISLQRFASVFASLLKSGLPIIEALNTSADSTGMPEMKAALHRVGDNLSRGLTVGEAFKNEPVFPHIVSNLIAISEKSGHLEEILTTLSGFYSSEIETSVKTLVTFIEPIMLLMIGLVIGTIALAVIVPVYQLTATF